MDMKTKIGALDKASVTVDVLFTKGERSLRRAVNAVMTDAGDYDRAATKARVEDVARGVAAKMEAGLFAPDAAQALPSPDQPAAPDQ